MSTLAIFHLGRRGLLGCRGLIKCGLREQTPLVMTSLVQKKQISLSRVNQERVYGPEQDHEKVDELHHWKNERIVAVALLPIIPAALAFPHPVLDTALVSAMFLHTHWRLSGVAGDYIHGRILPKIAQPLVLLFSICAFGSMCYFNYTDIGFANAVRLLYSSL